MTAGLVTTTLLKKGGSGYYDMSDSEKAYIAHDKTALSQLIESLREASTHNAKPLAPSAAKQMTIVTVGASISKERLTFELFVLPSPTSQPGAIVVVDPISTGAVLAHQIAKERGLEVIAVWSDAIPEELKDYVDPRCAVHYAAKVKHVTGGLDATVAALGALGFDVREVMVGCETGVVFTDELAQALGCRGNGTAKSALRRNKWLQTEAVRSAGLNACGQALANSSEDVEAFLCQAESDTLSVGFKAVVKPVEGAGSDGVSICDSPDAVRAAFASLEGTKNVLGLTNYSVLLQEYLKGDEYVVDTVSRSGVHKCVAIWKYDKRTFNGSGVVYFGMRLMPVDAEPALAATVAYVLGVLDALGIQNGAIHSEVKIEERGPVLIEANCRLHGGEGTWAPMAEACLGYSAVSAMLDSYLDPAAFAALPMVPRHFRAHAKEAKIRSAVSGRVAAINEAAMATIRGLPSYQSEMLTVRVGSRVEKTVDLITACGSFNLVHESLEQLEKDYVAVHEVLESGIFSVAADDEEGE